MPLRRKRTTLSFLLPISALGRAQEHLDRPEAEDCHRATVIETQAWAQHKGTPATTRALSQSLELRADLPLASASVPIRRSSGRKSAGWGWSRTATHTFRNGHRQANDACGVVNGCSACAPKTGSPSGRRASSSGSVPLQVLFPGDDGVQFRDAKVAALKAAQDAGQVGTTFPARFLLTAIGGGIPGAVMPGVGCMPAGPGVIMLCLMSPGTFMGLGPMAWSQCPRQANSQRESPSTAPITM